MNMFMRLVLFGILLHWKSSAVRAPNIIPIPDPNHDSTRVINGMAVKILSKCYRDFKDIVIDSTSDKSIIGILQEIEPFVIIIVSDSPKIHRGVQLRLHRNSFLMTPRSVPQLEKKLLTFKNSSQWDIMSPFFILDQSDKECKNARRILKVAWKNNLVKSFFLCVDSDRVPMVYTYNPYTNRAPRPWKQVPNTAKQSDGWTMYSRPHHNGNICDGMNFDRTKHLDGSIIRLAVEVWGHKGIVPDKDYGESIMSKMVPDMRDTVKKMKYFFNATFIFNIGQGQKLFDYVENGSCDVLVLLTLTDSHDLTYPVHYVSHHVVTNNRGFYTPLEKIANYYGMVTLISLCVILPITFMVIVLCGKTRRWSFAAFEILRLLINTALHTRLERHALRIFFSVIFLYFLILHATFQGHLVGFLMKQEYRPSAETLHDLRDPKYDTIYIYRTIAHLIDDPILKRKLVPWEGDCTKELIGKPSVACICTEREFLKPAFQYKFHVSEQPVLETVNVHRIRDDWPLHERFQKFLMWLESSRQTIHDYKIKLYARIREKQKRIAAMSEFADIRPISMSMLTWIFIFLMIGLKLASLCLAFERYVRNDATRRQENRRAARQNADRRRRQLINQILSTDYQLAVDARPRSI